MPVFMLVLGGFLGIVTGLVLGGGMAALAGLPVYGPVMTVLSALATLGPGAIGSHVLHPIGMLFGAGLGLLALSIFVYAFAAIGVITGVVLGERFSRGMLIGLAASVNGLVLSLIPWMPPGMGLVVFIVQILALIPAIAANPFYESVLGLSGWISPLNYLMLPLGVLMFLIAAPFAIAGIATGTGSVRFDIVTWTIETSGGFVLRTFSPAAAFNIGNFTFLPAPSPFSFTVAGTPAHETGHTLNCAAFGGFVYWIGAYDENVVPLARGPTAYTELLANSHFGGVGGPILPMW